MYKNGLNPEVGDIVKCVNATTSSYGFSTLRKGTEYEVTDVNQGTKSALIEVEGNDGSRFYKAGRFELIRRSGEGQSKNPPKYVVVSNEGKVIGTCMDDVTLNSRLNDLLLKNPSLRYNVYGYVSTAKTQTPKVEFTFDRSNDVNADTLTSEPVGHDQPFTRR